MSNYNLTELCKEDGVMSYNFTYQMNQEGFDLYCVCEYSGIEVKLNKDDCEFLNNTTYSLKWNKGKGS